MSGGIGRGKGLWCRRGSKDGTGLSSGTYITFYHNRVCEETTGSHIALLSHFGRPRLISHTHTHTFQSLEACTASTHQDEIILKHCKAHLHLSGKYHSLDFYSSYINCLITSCISYLLVTLLACLLWKDICQDILGSKFLVLILASWQMSCILPKLKKQKTNMIWIKALSLNRLNDQGPIHLAFKNNLFDCFSFNW